jgi:site-specific recombinase XerD
MTNRTCIVCLEKPARVRRKLCRTCETNKYMEQKYHEYKHKFAIGTDLKTTTMRSFIDYLDNSYGEQKREIAFRVKNVLDEIEKDHLILKQNWTIEDIVVLENYRSQLSVQRKTAMYHFVNYITDKYNLNEEKDEIRVQKTISDIPEVFQNVVTRYLKLLKQKRNQKHWTRFQLAFALKYFFDYITSKCECYDIRQIQPDHIIHYLRLLKEKNSQKTVHTRFRELDRFFTWAKKNQLIFNNPCKQINVKHYFRMTEPLTFEEQRALVSRWIDEKTNSKEALIGILMIVYACSSEEVRFLKMSDINENEISIDKRITNIHLAKEIIPILERYLSWRQFTSKGAEIKYLFINRESYKTKLPISHRDIWTVLSHSDLSARRLRATTLLEAAYTGDLKLLEAFGLSFEGTRPYVKAATPVLYMGHQ